MRARLTFTISCIVEEAMSPGETPDATCRRIEDSIRPKIPDIVTKTTELAIQHGGTVTWDVKPATGE